ncbi:MAG: hypothetical protein MSC31_17035, partial [Solirubrobacteraceae bacterium MAG38_C4-C5]|nr:hypothetical protein [Candidatus Siliceabacter maunaloa]
MSDTTTHETEILPPADAPAPNGAHHGEVLDDAASPPATRGEPARPARAEGTLMPLPAEQVVAGMRAYQQLLRELLDPSDWQTHDKNDRPLDKPFLKKSGWRKIARAFNLSFECVHSRVERDEHGHPERAEVWIRAVAPNGQYGDGDGYCSADEGRFQSNRGKAKIENDLRATATTRAKNRAVSDLVGMGEVSAEEINPDAGQDPEHQQVLANGAKASDELRKMAFEALTRILDDRAAAKAVGQRIADEDGHLCAAAARALVYLAVQQAHTQRGPSEPPPAAPHGQNPAAQQEADRGPVALADVAVDAEGARR